MALSLQPQQGKFPPLKLSMETCEPDNALTILAVN